MGSVNNSKLGKPGGAKALAAEYLKYKPADAGVWGTVSIDARKILNQKKVKVPSKAKAVSSSGKA